MANLTTVQKKTILEAHGWTCGPRNPLLNTRFSGSFMAVEQFEDSELPTEDGSNGPWCIVGDDLDALIDVDAYLAEHPDLILMPVA